MLVFGGGVSALTTGDFEKETPAGNRHFQVPAFLRKAQPTDFCWAILLMWINNRLDHMATSSLWYAKLPPNVQVIHIQLNLLFSPPPNYVIQIIHIYQLIIVYPLSIPKENAARDFWHQHPSLAVAGWGLRNVPTLLGPKETTAAHAFVVQAPVFRNFGFSWTDSGRTKQPGGDDQQLKIRTF